MSATLSSHILDTHLGKPAADVAVTLHRIRDNGAATLLAHGTTNSDGRVTPDAWQFDTAIDSTEHQLNIGRYTVTFDTQSYFNAQQLTAFYPQVVIDFVVNDASHYHVPLLLSAHGYSTYRGS
ncbi:MULTISPECIES: hydroxyisourate hydrolase [Psychrobacter]|uniref:hydroxyisourate hydrolase n=1 Tax=Psychrobacter TaxID=497 RepID=UPI00086E1747|nr:MULTISPECIES: hydroxyisourate hydrolase [Psychrobacter]MBA6244074.1 hydroxyisourate hydrolase [Psychrobacter sp. Urea-trap-18]MBA6284884.1 hydroxyisourate hydrolase [Psychrobacter sp. Urea-trap-16]MBA6319470.1 hydroxyisourate hydrolase [Psychrobacter sp. Urea-trap-20]MBA6335364.1 hydroxyisourate hydrolase [Psychrobacter sp. Urea-trap-19]NYR08344.1 hydroxyisourate hydrolase [Psychrobacter sp. BI730]|tara:strand:- start:5835 stop:6203 length:369 start_codon:yes stop_codon:yes gene_type:complete